jgi:DNA repair protein RadA/Sms
VKNRYGPADEVGCFDLTDDGIVGLADPTRLFVGHGQSPVPGTAITVALEGRRTLLCELQALVGAAPQQPVGSPRRASSGLDTARVAMLLAVTEKVGKLGLASREVYTATVGGVRIYDPAADLALALAVFGAALNTSVRPGLAAVGEVGLAGEVRPVPAVRARVQEAARLGFRTVLVPPGTGTAVDGVDGVDVVEVAELRDARRLALG